jgi:hypothetical protein
MPANFRPKIDRYQTTLPAATPIAIVTVLQWLDGFDSVGLRAFRIVWHDRHPDNVNCSTPLNLNIQLISISTLQATSMI